MSVQGPQHYCRQWDVLIRLKLVYEVSPSHSRARQKKGSQIWFVNILSLRIQKQIMHGPISEIVRRSFRNYPFYFYIRVGGVRVLILCIRQKEPNGYTQAHRGHFAPPSTRENSAGAPT
jgi:hypothetical protein